MPLEIIKTKFVAFSNDELQALDSAHSEIRVVRGATPPAKRWDPDYIPEPPWEAVFRKPVTGESDAFEGAANNDKAKAGALRNLAKATIVGVSLNGKHTVCLDRADRGNVNEVRAAWDSLRAIYPGAHMASQEMLTDLNGMAQDEGGKE